MYFEFDELFCSIISPHSNIIIEESSNRIESINRINRIESINRMNHQSSINQSSSSINQSINQSIISMTTKLLRGVLNIEYAVGRMNRTKLNRINQI